MINTINIFNWKTGKVIFSYECKNNRDKITVEKAAKLGINLSYADLKNADLSHIDLSRTNLDNADLSYADLYESNLSFTNLSNANLSYAGLNLVNLSNTNLSNATLYHASLDHSDLSTAILDNVKGLNNQCPKEGTFIGWKKCYSSIVGPVIVKLEIPVNAKRSSATTNKCRCDKARVLDIQNLDGTKVDINEARSYFDEYFKYRNKGMRRILDFDERYWIECAPGIHFFMNREDAVKFEI